MIYNKDDLVQIGQYVGRVLYTTPNVLNIKTFSVESKVVIRYLEGPMTGQTTKFHRHATILEKLSEKEKALWEIMNS